MLANVLDQIQDKPHAAPMPIEVLDFLHANKIPQDIIEDLKASSYSEWIQIGSLSLLPIPKLIEQTEGISPCLENGYLVLAGGANGDPVAVHRDTRRMVFISHDRLYEEPENFLACVHETPYLYEEFWERVIAEAEFPWDYYEAKDRWPC
ncbi:MAG TPA: hypothetical protein VHB99_05985 [Pirellulales bacterium]|nr:hypothetical protein [Pirellulales bacterium]